MSETDRVTASHMVWLNTVLLTCCAILCRKSWIHGDEHSRLVTVTVDAGELSRCLVRGSIPFEKKMTAQIIRRQPTLAPSKSVRVRCRDGTICRREIEIITCE